MINDKKFLKKLTHDLSPLKASLKLSATGEWYLNNKREYNNDIIDYLFSNYGCENGKRHVLFNDRKIPVTLESDDEFVTDIVFSGAGSFENILLKTTIGDIKPELNSIWIDRSDNSLYCLSTHDKLILKFRRSALIKISERLTESASGDFYLKLCGKLVKIQEK